MEFPIQEAVLLYDYELAETLLINHLKAENLSASIILYIFFDKDIGKYIKFDKYFICLSLLKEIFNNNNIHSAISTNIKEGALKEHFYVFRSTKDLKINSDRYKYFTPQHLVDTVDILNDI